MLVGLSGAWMGLPEMRIGGGQGPDDVGARDRRDSSQAEIGVRDKRSVARDAFAEGRSQPLELSPDEQARVRELKRTDQEVRAHEAAHMAAGGAYVRGGPAYSYTSGPDGKRYAVSGEVSIDTSPVPNDPEATAAKMRVIRRAALAPARPSNQDLSVAARAAQSEAAASIEAAAERLEGASRAASGAGGNPASLPDRESNRDGRSPVRPALGRPGLDVYV